MFSPEDADPEHRSVACSILIDVSQIMCVSERPGYPIFWRYGGSKPPDSVSLMTLTRVFKWFFKGLIFKGLPVKAALAVG